MFEDLIEFFQVPKPTLKVLFKKEEPASTGTNLGMLDNGWM
jgi:hypothetical protein